MTEEVAKPVLKVETGFLRREVNGDLTDQARQLGWSVFWMTLDSGSQVRIASPPGITSAIEQSISHFRKDSRYRNQQQFYFKLGLRSAGDPKNNRWVIETMHYATVDKAEMDRISK